MEFVYVVPRTELFPDHYPLGLVPFGEEFPRARFEAVVREHGYFVEREKAERDPMLKQIIPYTIVCVDPGPQQEDGGILLLRRLAKGGEARLRGKLSIGVGGHINPEDLSPLPNGRGESEEEHDVGSRDVDASSIDPIRLGTRRELHEELELSGSYEIETIGMINDDTNPVGAVHVGLVQVLTTAKPVGIRETEVLEGRLTPPRELQALFSEGANFETWSSILVERLGEVLPSTGRLVADQAPTPGPSSQAALPVTS